MNSVVYFLIATGVLFFGGTTIAAFYWAARNGQFRNLEAGARVIFDADEPVGVATDAFTDSNPGVPLNRPGALDARKKQARL